MYLGSQGRPGVQDWQTAAEVGWQQPTRPGAASPALPSPSPHYTFSRGLGTSSKSLMITVEIKIFPIRATLISLSVHSRQRFFRPLDNQYITQDNERITLDNQCITLSICVFYDDSSRNTFIQSTLIKIRAIEVNPINQSV